MIILSAKNVSKIYKMDGGVVNALDDVSLDIKKGEFLAIMGPSGSGKSTLMHLLGCLDTPTSGKIILEGDEVSKLSEEALAKIRNKKIGFVFQSFNLLPKISALENVEIPLIYSNLPRSERKKRALSALNSVGLADRIHHLPNQLSGGQQQKVAIARSLVTEPAIIVADEPTGNLDSKSGTEIMKILTRLNNEGHTIIIVTHEREIADWAKRLIRLKDGRIVKE